MNSGHLDYNKEACRTQSAFASYNTCMPLSQGQVLNNRYRIVKLLGQGGFGAVYRAWDFNFDGPVAIKECSRLAPDVVRQFIMEARLLFHLRHPNLPKVYDSFGVAGQGQYLVMEFIAGEDLESMLVKAGGPLPEAQVLGWILQVCDALSYLHRQNPAIIHRDIKPANIRITPDGQAILVDFGISKEYDPNQKTMEGARAVTPGFSPIEQYGMGRTDARSDVYALGATLYNLLTNQIPPESLSVRMGLSPAPPPVQVINPAVSQFCSAVIEQAMEIAMLDRFASIEAFKNALMHSPVISGSPASPGSPAQTGVRGGDALPGAAQAAYPRPAAGAPHTGAGADNPCDQKACRFFQETRAAGCAQDAHPGRRVAGAGACACRAIPHGDKRGYGGGPGRR